MNQPFDSGDDQFDPTVDRLLQQAFAGRPADSTGRASLVDVRTRARRHQRRRAGAMVGAAAVVGIGGVGVLSQRDDSPTTATPGDGGATSTTADFANCWNPQQEYPTTTILVADPATTLFDAGGNTLPPTPTFPAMTTVVATSTTVVDPTTTTAVSDGLESTSTFEPPRSTFADFSTTTALLDPSGVPVTVPCQPTGQYRCIGNTGTDELGYTYFEYCETWAQGSLPYVTSTTVVGAFVVIVDASGLPGAADDMFSRLSNSGFGAIQVLPATRTMEQTMLMPTGDGSGLDILRQLTGIDGFDTWSPDLIDGDLPMGAGAVVVIGQDYWDRMTLSVTTLMPSTTTTVPDSTVSAP